MTTNPYRAGERILRVGREFPDRTALVIGAESWTYAELLAAAAQLANCFKPAVKQGAQEITAVMAQRHISSYAGILAARLSGHAYVPLNVNHPCQRNATILQNSGARRIICGQLATYKLQNILELACRDADRPAIVGCGDGKADYDLPTAANALLAADGRE